MPDPSPALPEPTPEEGRMAMAFCAALECGDIAAARRALETSEFVRRRINMPAFDFGQRAAHTVANDVAMLDLLIEFGADVNLRSEWANGPYTVLDHAREEAARFLLSRGATLTAHVAARLGWMEELQRLAEVDPDVVHERGGDGKQPLHDAATVEIADYLVQRGAGIDVRCMDHQSTPAQYAVAERPQVCRWLLERGATPDIFMAARLGDVGLTERVLRETPSAIRARVNAPGYDAVPPFNIYCWTLGFQTTPHAIALTHGHRDVYEVLLEHSPDSVRLLDAATRADRAAAREVLARDPRLVATLTADDHSLLAHAIFHGHFDAADVMLELGFDPGVGGVDGGSALHAACWMGHVGLVERVVARGVVPIDARDPKHGSTPLGWAAFGSVHRRAAGDYVAVIDRLVAAGADITVPGNRDGESYLGMSHGNDEVQTALRRHGAQ